MTGRVDARALVVRDGATGIPFAVDCGTGTATLDPGGEPHRLRVLRWGEKCSLARFADSGAGFIEQQFVAICGGGVLPEDPTRRAAATALALWLNRPLALPLDPPLLGEVTIRLCAALGVGPAELAALPAPEVEALWHAVRAEATEAGAADGPAPPAVDGVTRILIEPDPPARVECPPQAEPSPDPEAAVPISAEPGPLDRAGAAAQPAAASVRPGSIPVSAAPRPAGTAAGPGRAEAAPARPGSIPVSAAPRPAGTAGGPGRAEAACTHPGSLPAPAAPRPADPAASRERAPVTLHPRGTRAAAAATGAGQGVEAAAEATEAGLPSGMPPGTTADDVPRALSSKAGPIDGPASPMNGPGDPPPVPPRRLTATPARDSGRLAATSAIPSAPRRASGAGAASGALRSPSRSPSQPLARFRLVPAREAESDLPGPCVGDGPPPAGRSSSERSGHGPPRAPRSAATAASVRAPPNRRRPGTQRPDQGRSADLAAAVEPAGPAGPDDISAVPTDPGLRPTALAGPTIAGSNLVSPRAPEASPARHEPAGGGRRRAASRPKSPMPRFAAARPELPSFPPPETEAATAIDSRLRALIDIVSRVSETPSDLDGNPEAVIDAFSERLVEAASELGLASCD